MSQQRILVIGQDPETVDFSTPALSSFNADMIKAGIEEAKASMARAGYDFDFLLTDAGETAADVVATRLEDDDYDVIIIGAGIRMQPPQTGLFEDVINTVIEMNPSALIGFNSTPQDTAEAVRRLIG